MTAIPEWTGLTVAIAGTGPSLEAAQVEAVRAAGMKVVAVRRAIELAPDPDLLVLHGYDEAFAHYGGLIAYPWPDPRGRGFPNGFLFADPELPSHQLALDLGQPLNCLIGDYTHDHPCPTCGEEWRCWQRGLGLCAIDLVMQAGATEIMLLGYDGGMTADRRHHFYDEVPLFPRGIELLPLEFEFCWTALAQKAERLGVPIVNASPMTRLVAFPRVAGVTPSSSGTSRAASS